MLENIRILDIGRYVAGPYCATLLGALGAEIIRVEKPNGGEDRYISPLNEDAEQPEQVMGGLFLQTACGKKSVSLNLAEAEGRDILKKLAATADVIVANMPAKALEKLQLDWPQLQKFNPKAILVTQTAYGNTGPDKDKGGFDGVAQAQSGAMFLTGTPDQPVKAGAPYVDYSTAVMSAFATLAALMQRQQTGRGQHVETTLLGTALSVMNAHLIEQAVTQKNRVGTGNRVQTSAPSDVFKTQDGHVLIHTVGDGLFKRWAAMIGQPELAQDPDYQGDQNRGDKRDELCAMMQQWCADKPTDEVLSALDAAGVPAGPVMNLQSALENPQVAAMSFFKDVPVPNMDKTAPVVGLPVTFSDYSPAELAPPPMIGAHTDEILEQLDYNAEQINMLKEKGVVS